MAESDHVDSYHQVNWCQAITHYDDPQYDLGLNCPHHM